MAITVIAILGGVLLKRSIMESPEDTLVEYMNHIEKKEYEVMYTMIAVSYTHLTLPTTERV